MTRALLAFVLALLAGGCAEGPGEFCVKDADCRTGLRCAASTGGRGVCSYPPSGPLDASHEARPVEARPVEARPVEARPVEARPVEARATEARPADASRNDTRSPDLASGE